MPYPLPFRKTPIHLPVREAFNRPIIIFVTVCSAKRKPIFCSKEAHDIIVRAWREADGWLVGRYVIMPDHIHLFCSPATMDYPDLTRWIQYWKSLSSRTWPRESDKPIWQRSFWDTQLRRGQCYEERWEYARQNPVKKGLVRNPNDWPYQGEMKVLRWKE
jgi:REP element-mobilizing transposase RayT